MSRKREAPASATSPAKKKGVPFFHHFPKDFLRPYGLAVQGGEATDDATFAARLHPYTCEWLNRPGIACSEFLATLEENLKPAFENLDMLMNEEVQKHITTHGKKLSKLLAFTKLDSADASSHATKKKRCKRAFKQLRKKDEATDAWIKECIATGASMYLLGIHCRVAQYIANNIPNLNVNVEGNLAAFASDKNDSTYFDAIISDVSKRNRQPPSSSGRSLREIFSQRPATSTRNSDDEQPGTSSQ
uniref:Uncharacterized protein LOC108950742 n=1 Tax=Phallusia mammillata TaxID=59560 RepID=A0A6F9DJX4_9ASCI|nr:uncharacterized protein LOC108950742 [Phallusia mammillata]